MGATVTTGKRVYAYADKAGQPVYVLCEETYEKNVFPHTPRWSVVAFGRIEAVMQRVFSSAAVTCGGMLQGRGGWITPTGYVAAWLKELASPRPFTDRETRLTVSKSFWERNGIVEDEDTENAYTALHAAGYASVVDRLTQKEPVVLSYHDDADALCVLATAVPPWRFVNNPICAVDTQGDFALGHHPRHAPTPPSIPLPGLFRMSQKGDREGPENIVVARNGQPVIGEWEYAVREEWVKDYARYELSHPGHFQRLYRALVKHLDDLPLLPAETRVQVDVSQLQRNWQKQSA